MKNFKHLYSPKPQKGPDHDEAHILETFRKLFKQGKKGVELLNYYKGVPLTFPATLLEVERDLLYLDIHPQQAVAFEKDRNTFIRCKAFHHDICASVDFVDVQRRVAIMKNFHFAEILAAQRTAIRLSLTPPAETVFEVQGEKVTGGLLDISMDGAAVLVARLPEHENGFETQLLLKLPNNIQHTFEMATVPARHVATKEHDSGQVCIFSLAQGKSPDEQVSKFIFRRQVEIIRELKDASI